MPVTGAVEYVRLTGPPAAKTGLDEASFLPDKRFQLLAYLAYDGGWVGRERAAFLFWPDSDTATSKQNLRGLLKRLRTLPFEPGVEVTNHHLRWQVPTDVGELKQALATTDARTVLTAYRGPLLSGMEGDPSGEFGEWLEIERESLYGRWRAAVLSRMAELLPGEEAEATALLRRVLDEDPLDEEAVRAYLETTARLGGPSMATSVYAEFTSRLAREMGLEPTASTAAAYQGALEAQSSSVRVERADRRTSMAAGARNDGAAIPAPTTSFVGREEELAEIAERLHDAACRLLSLIGPGGAGKTRLALRVSRAAVPELSDSVRFVPLDTVSSAEDVLPRIAAALGVEDRGGPGLFDSVSRALATEGRSLLVLDNFEQVLGAAELLLDLLTAAPDLKVVVTTRERLGLDAEWVYPVAGLGYPPGRPRLADVESFPAARLLLDRVRRVRPAFAFEEQDMPWLERFFALTQGLPLAIELAAVWLRAMTLRDLVQELGTSLDVLSTAAPDAIGRHASMRGVFEQSWSRLSVAEREVLGRIAVFAGPATTEAAVFVAGANRVTLASLVDRSLLRLDSAGRYDRHPLLQQFAREKLAASEAEQEAAERRHAAYYLRFLRERTDAAFASTTAKALAEVHQEIHEIKAACRRAARRGDDEQLIAFLVLLELDIGYFLAHGHDDESLALLARAADAAAAAGSLAQAADLRGRVGDAYGILRGDARRAIVEYEAAAQLARMAGSPREAVFVSLCGLMRQQQGAQVVWTELDRALELARQSGDAMVMVTVLEHRAYVLAQSGDLMSARDHYRELLAELDGLPSGGAHPYEVPRRRFYATMNMGAADHQLGNYEEALAARQVALHIAEEMGNAIWQAHVHLELGEMYGSRGEHAAARDELLTAQALYLENNVISHLARVEKVSRELGYELSDEVEREGSAWQRG